MSHALGVVGHTGRAELIDRLTKTVEPDILSIDNGQLGCEGNHRHVWERLSNEYPRSGWAVVLEDDALPVAGFDKQIEAALRVAPTPVVSLYLGRKRPPQYQAAIKRCIKDRTAEPHWFLADRLLHAVGVAIRTSLVPGMLASTAQCVRPIDESISRWAMQMQPRMPVSYTWPSLVDHADRQTVVQHRDRQPRPPGRVAWRHGTRDAWHGTYAWLAL